MKAELRQMVLWVAALAAGAGCGRGPEGEFSAGKAELAAGRVETGAACLERALAGGAEAEWAGEAWNWLGLAYERLGRDGDAEEAFGQAAKLGAGDAAAAYNAGRMALKRGDEQKGITWLKKASDLDAEDVRALLEIGEWTTRKGRLDLAQRMYYAALKRDGRNAVATTGLGRIALLKEEWGQAETHFLNALEYDKDYGPALYNLGVLHMRKGGDAEQGKAYFRQYLEVAPKGAKAGAVGMWMEGKTVEQTSFQEPQAKGPDRKAGEELAAAQKAQSAGDAEGAAEHVMKALTAAREGGKQNAQRGAVVKRAVAMFGGRADVQLEAGDYYMETGDAGAALAAFTKAQAAEPGNPLVLLRLSRAAAAMEEYDTAVLSLRKLTELEPRNADARWELAELYGELGMYGKSEGAYREFEKQFPTDSRAGEVGGRLKALDAERKALQEGEE